MSGKLARMILSLICPRPLAMIGLALGLALSVSLTPTPAMAGEKEEVAAFARALAEARAGDWTAAMGAAQGAGVVSADVIQWQRLRAAQGTLAEYEDFLAKRPDWPGMPLLREKGEPRLADISDPARVLAYFAKAQPRSAAGSIALAKALAATGQADKAADEALRGWTLLKFTSDQEAALLAQFPGVQALGNTARLDRILWAGERVDEAGRMLPRVSADWQALARARLALRANESDAAKAVSAVPASVADDPGLAYERFVWRMKRDLYPDATEMILARSGSAKSLGDPAAWAERRALLTRYLLRTGSVKQAYRVASSNQLTEGDAFNDLEFLSGFIALRKLGDPGRALEHFRHLPEVGTPITMSRRAYWMGRAQEALGQSEAARASYQTAAGNQSAFYGLLAAEKLGLTIDKSLLTLAWPKGDWRKASFAKSSVLAAAVRLAKAGDEQLSARFLVHLCESLTPEEMGVLAGMALQMNEIRSGVLIAKAAAEKGVLYPGAYYPIPDVVPYDLAVSRALALAIARRESEFDPEATSSAGALGLMQLMPETAKIQAKLLGLPYDKGRLTSDPGYNVQLGSEYLKGLLDKFGPSVALIAVGYNAGPKRATDWMASFGDPRSEAVDAVDWVETIPFNETRTYVMRVTESVVIYRAKLKGKPVPVAITSELTGR